MSIFVNLIGPLRVIGGRLPRGEFRVQLGLVKVSPVLQREGNVLDGALVVQMHEGGHLVLVSAQSPLGHHAETLCGPFLSVVRKEMHVSGNRRIVLPHADLGLTTTSAVDKLVLLVDINVTNTKTCTKRTANNLLIQSTSVPNSVFALSHLV